jgi:predicted nuclease with TOPRIM domain
MTKISPPATKNDLNSLRHDMNSRFGEMEHRFGEMEHRFGEMENRFGEMEHRFGEIGHRFDIMEEHFVKWKSEIHDLIDEGFTSKAKNLDEEVGVLNSRTIEIRQKVEKLESIVYKN